MASVGMLAAGVAHEINNPLAAVIANLDFAIEDLTAITNVGVLPELADLKCTLHDARCGAERVRMIVKDLKIFSRAEEDRHTSVDIERVLESTLRMAWNEIRHRARLVKSFGAVPFVEANESRLGQLFLNLIVNAAQAITEGRADHNEIHVTTRVEPTGRVAVEIRDSGPGIPPEILNKLFTPFFTTKPAGVGTGLGLVICQRIVADLGGEISVESQVGVGTVFKVVLRVATSQPKPDAAVLARPRATRRGRILVVDDDELLRQAVSRTLSREHDLRLVTCAEEALACLDAGLRYDVILCDMMMPVVTGAELYDQILKRAPDQAERIIFLTGGVFSVQTREFLNRVANSCVEKPYDGATLRALVNERVR
jgi:CheY-like chemotaxis protein